ncbi:MAG: FAD-binding oxidoreductase [Pseudomonadota bacterium]
MTGYLTLNDRPGRHAPSWYAATAGEIPARPRLQGTVKADICVVGGGYAGLAAALHLAEAGAAVVLLEANRVGWGASGRNGGLLGVEPRADIRAYERAIGREDARKVWEISLAANRLVRRLIARHGIDCHLTDGYLLAAHRQGAAREVAEWVEHVHSHYDHTSARWLDANAIQDYIATSVYFGGYADSLGAHLHPLRLSLGLARAAERAGARLLEDSRAIEIARGLVRTTDGAVRADRILVAANGYIDGLIPPIAQRSIPINNFVIATEPMDPDRARRLMPNSPGVADTRFVVNYFHFSPDCRMIWGGGETYGKRFPNDIAALVRPRMLAVFPELADLPVGHAWGGTLAITPTRMPVFHNAGGGTYAIHGWSGSGIHMATMGGKIAAEALLGPSADWDLMARLPAPAFPGGDWFRMPLLALAMSWYALRDRL